MNVVTFLGLLLCQSHFKSYVWAKCVATLTLGLWLKQGLAKVRAKTEPENHISCSQECKKMWGNEPSHIQMNSHFGSWSPNGLLNFQRAIARVKTHWIEAFRISLETSWNLDVWNRVAWPIWTFETQVMAKRKMGIKLTIWLPTTKSRESPWFPCMQMTCNIPLESSRRGLQLFFKPHLN
jgi:hypothetical protein